MDDGSFDSQNSDVPIWYKLVTLNQMRARAQFSCCLPFITTTLLSLLQLIQAEPKLLLMYQSLVCNLTNTQDTKRLRTVKKAIERHKIDHPEYLSDVDN